MKKSSFQKAHILCLGIGIIVIILSVILRFSDPYFFHVVNLKVLDLFFHYRGTRQPTGQVVIVAVDEKSIASLGRLGRWPWSRATIALLVNRLIDYGAKTIGFDMVFSELESQEVLTTIDSVREFIRDSIPIERSKKELIERYLTTIYKQKFADKILSDTLKKSSNSVAGVFFFVSPDEIRYFKDSSSYKENLKLFRNHRILQVFESDNPVPAGTFFEPIGVNLNIRPVMESAAGSGFFNALPDSDGAIRRMPLVCRFKDDFYPSLALKLVSEYLDQPIKLYLNDFGIEQIKVGNSIPPVDLEGTLMINYAGPSMTIPHYSAVDILGHKIDEKCIRDKLVIIGITATGLYDIRITPFSAVYPGVEIHANEADNILGGRYLYFPWWINITSVCVIILLGILLSLILPRIRVLVSGICSFIIGCSVFGGSFILFKSMNIWYPPVYEVIMVFTVSIALMLTKFIVEEKERKFIKNAFSQYLSPQFVNQLAMNPDLLKLGGEEKILTVLFTDVVGFTAISEKLSPAELVELLNLYTTEMSDIIMQHGGTIDKYSGDSIMAFFGAPIYFSDHAHQACSAALAMQLKLDELREKSSKSGRPFFATRIGINTGKMVVGNMGSKQKFNYTVLGDAVNLASRLEGANKLYNTMIIIGDETHKTLGTPFHTRELDLVKVVGKNQPVRIFELLNPSGISEEFLSYYNNGMSLFRTRKWNDALTRFRQALKVNSSDKPSQIHCERCMNYLSTPPPEEWNGAYSLETK